MNKKQYAIQRLKGIRKARNNIFIIHYSCESFGDKQEGYSPRISSIAIKDLYSGQTHSFSIHKTAELQHIPKSEIEQQYDSIERVMLDEFFTFIARDKAKIYVHWNMRDINYGFQAIYHRYQVLGGKPIIIDESRLVDLPDMLGDIYGSGYADHPKMESLIDLNEITKRGFLKGAEEAEAFAGKHYNKLHISTLRKANALSEILDKQLEGTLKTKTHPLVEKIKDLHSHWSFQLAEIVLAIVGLLTIVSGIRSIITP